MQAPIVNQTKAARRVSTPLVAVTTADPAATIDALVGQAQQAVKGVSPEALREAANLRQTVESRLGEITKQLDTLMVDRPKRAISFDDEDDAQPAPGAAAAAAAGTEASQAEGGEAA